jgi:hypothetical protein
MGSFKAVGNTLERRIQGPFVNIDAGFACSGGPIQSSRKHSWKTLLGPFVNVEAGFAFYGGLIQSSQNNL